MEDIKRMFLYHGAEHKAIHCFEHGLPMTPDNARQFPRLHVRCGTAFLIMVMVIAILVYTCLLYTSMPGPTTRPWCRTSSTRPSRSSAASTCW